MPYISLLLIFIYFLIIFIYFSQLNMSHRIVLAHLITQINILKLCKSIEMMTIMKLNALQKKIENNKHLIKVLYCYLKDNIRVHAGNEKHLIIPFFTDKNCSGKINNSL